MSTKLNAERVREIFVDCLFREGEDNSNHVEVEGITRTDWFHPDRLEGHKVEIEAMLNELPSEFKRSGGGGWSFLKACFDKHGNHWAEHRSMEKLFQLGIAIGAAEYLMQKDVWGALPGGMPYYIIN